MTTLLRIYVALQSDIAAEHPIETLSSCGTSITMHLLVEFEPLTIAASLFLTTPMKRVCSTK